MREDGARLFRTYSDEGYLIEQKDTGKLYEEAIDVENAQHIYVETNITIDNYGDS